MRDRLTIVGLLASVLVIGASILVWMSPTYRWQAGVWVFFPFGMTSGGGPAINAWGLVIAWFTAWGVIAGLLLPLNDWRIWMVIGGVCFPLFAFGTLFWVTGSYVFDPVWGCGRGSLGGCPMGMDGQTGPLLLALAIGIGLMTAAAIGAWRVTRPATTRRSAAIAKAHR